jgi:hypothetical protein
MLKVMKNNILNSSNERGKVNGVEKEKQADQLKFCPVPKLNRPRSK